MNINCIVDVASREVSFQENYRIAAYDHNVDVIHFSIEPIEDFSLDLSSIKIAAQGPNGVRHDYAVDPSTVSIEEETGYITFDWPIPAGVTEMPIGTFKYGDRGRLIFAVCAEIIDGSTVSKAWHSDDGIITVVAHLEPESGGGEDPSETATNAQKIGQLQTDVAVVQRTVAAVAGGTPTVVDSASDMTDTSKIYVLSTDSKWYYHDGTAWTSGGVYGGAVTSTTFDKHGVPADDFAVGEALADKADSADVTALDTRVTAVEGDVSDLKEDLSALGGIEWTESDGYISVNGTIETPTASAEKNTNRISVKQGDVLEFSMSFNEAQSMWAGYATYNEIGAFVERVMIVANISGNKIHHIFTVGSGVGSIAFTYRSFGSYSPTICKYSQMENANSDASNSINAINISNLAKRVGDYPCELGSIYYGDNTDATNRCRTSGFISVALGDAFKCDNPYLNYSITLYTEAGAFISDTGWKSGEFIVSNSSAHFARVNMRKADNSVIATTEISDIANDVKFIRSDIWGAIDEINVESTKLASIVQTVNDYDCELGTIYLGQNEASTTRCRTSGFIQTFGCKIIVKGEYLCAVELYDNDKNFILDTGWQKTEYVVSDAKVRYIRLAMRKKDSSEISNAEVPTIASTFTIIRKIDDSCFTKPYELPTYFETEAEDCASKLKAYCTEKALVFGIVTDTHIYEAPIAQKWWHDTVANMARVNDIYPLDSIIHLGDIINGSLPSDRSGLLLEEARDDLNSIIKPTFMLVGNHDPNLFYDNGSDPINEGEMYALIERYNEIDTTARPSGKPYWYKDYEPLGIRVIYLSAHMGDGYDKSEQSWGYPQEEVSWYSNIALNTDKQVLILSHMPFSQGYISYVSTAPTNGDEMKSATDAFISGGGIVIGLINGHTHFDYVHNNGNFKEISLGAETNTNNTSDKTGTGIYGYAPETAIQYGRTFGTLTQDLWSILVVRPTSKTCKLIRFGAGADVEWSY